MAKQAGIKGNEDLDKDDKPVKEEPKAAKKDEGPNLSADVESAQKPYPSGSPQDPEEEFAKIHGFRRDGK